MHSHEIANCVQGHHIYKSIWTLVLGEELQCIIEENNIEDQYMHSVAVTKENFVVVHIPK